MGGKKYLVVTYGCQMNVHDSETIAGILEQMGYTPAEGEEDADIILLNTCAIREIVKDLFLGFLAKESAYWVLPLWVMA